MAFGLKPLGKLTSKKGGYHKMNGWYGFDLDGTIAEYHGWVSPTHIGKPIWPVLDLMRKYLNDGQKVKIFTARAQYPEAILAIQDWLEWLGFPRLDVTNVKDYDCIRIYDDRAVQVESNTGRIIKG